MIFSTSFNLSGKRLFRTVLFSVITTILIAVGVFAALKNIKEDADASITPSGDKVEIIPGETMVNLPGTNWGTHRYKVSTVGGGKTMVAWCIDPGKLPPSQMGGVPVTQITENSVSNRKIKLLIYGYTRNNQYANQIKDIIYSNAPSSINSDNLYAFMWALIAYLNGRSIPSEYVSYANNISTALGEYVSMDDELWAVVRPFQLYTLDPSKVSSTEQNLTWIEENYQTGGIEVQKCETTSQSCTPSGAVDFSGITFQLRYKGAATIYDSVRDTFYVQNQLIPNMVATTNRSGKASFTRLPIGNYEVVEVSSDNPSLVFSGQMSMSVDVPVDRSAVVTFYNRVKRGDVKFVKKNNKNEIMKNIPFRITNLDTNENHIVVTNRNGEINTSSSFFAHTRHTNGYDTMLIDNITNQAYGTWFEWSNSTSSNPDDSVGALPYGHYKIEELNCNANKNCSLGIASKTFVIEEDNVVIDLGTWTNECSDIAIVSTVAVKDGDEATDPEAGKNVITASESTTIKDTVRYCGVPGRRYTIMGELKDRATGNDLPVRYTSYEKDVTAPTGSGCGNETMYFTLDTSSLAGTQIVVYERLYDESHDLVAEHVNRNDADQIVTIVPPDVDYMITTNASGNGETEKSIQAAADARITDSISYCAIADTDYTLRGVLKDKNGNTLAIAGSEVTKELHTTSKCGTTEMVFNFDASSLAGSNQEIVVFEYLLDNNNVVVASHEDLNDQNQTIHVYDTPDDPTPTPTPTPSLHEFTSLAKDKEDGDKLILAKTDAQITDRVTICAEDASFTLKLRLINRSTGQPLRKSNGDVIERQSTLVFDGYKCINDVNDFTIDTSNLAGEQIMVYGELFDSDGTLIDYHPRENDSLAISSQTVKVYTPGFEYEVSTDAVDGSGDGDKYILPMSNATIKDTITYRLQKDKSYTFRGILYDKSTNQPLTINGARVEVTRNIEITNESGSFDMNFALDARGLEGKQIVVFEYIYELGSENIVALHESINDPRQTVSVVSLDTVATDATDNDKTIFAQAGQQIKDTVSYCLAPNKTFTLKSVLKDKSNNSTIAEQSESITTTDSACGTKDIIFNIDATTLAGKSIVAFEYALEGNTQIVAHEDINDADQTVYATYVYQLDTVATDAADNDKVIFAQAGQQIKDTVSYCLEPNKTFTLKSVLKDKSNNSTIAEQSESITTTNSACGTKDIIFNIDATTLAGKSIVAFEYALEGNTQIIAHEDINDADQTVIVYGLDTNASDFFDGNDSILAAKDQTIVDNVTYCLTAGKSYTIEGILMEKSSNTELIVDGQTVEASVDFVPTSDCGEIELFFNLDASALAGKELVVFETAYEGDDWIISHEDITDDKQTVTVVELDTSASDAADGDKNILAAEHAKIVDHVSYCLTAGQEYTLKGVLMDKETGQPFPIEGALVEESIIFTPETDCGSIDMFFEFNATNIANAQIVVFESVYQNSELIVAHHDIEDEDQTVTVYPITPDTGEFSVPLTGGQGSSNANPIVFAVTGVTLLAVGYAGYRWFARRNSLKFN